MEIKTKKKVKAMVSLLLSLRKHRIIDVNYLQNTKRKSQRKNRLTFYHNDAIMVNQIKQT